MGGHRKRFQFSDSQSIAMMKHRSVRVILQMVVVLVAVGGVLVWQQDYLSNLYFRNQLTRVGWIINGAILVLFLVGLMQLVYLFIVYGREEAALDQFLVAVRTDDPEKALINLPPKTIIAERYQTVVDFYSVRSEINHNALAATLLAKESSRTSFAKFVNNILILTGVFGTIASLTVALVGASTAITDVNSIEGIDIVIHGMSTALSTTMTAILAYFLFGYFYLKLLDTQSYVLGRIEHVTATALMPQYQRATRSPEQNLNELLTNTIETIGNFEEFFKKIQLVSQDQNAMFARFESITQQNMELLSEIRTILRAGFRLRDSRDDFDDE